MIKAYSKLWVTLTPWPESNAGSQLPKPKKPMAWNTWNTISINARRR